MRPRCGDRLDSLIGPHVKVAQIPIQTHHFLFQTTSTPRTKCRLVAPLTGAIAMR